MAAKIHPVLAGARAMAAFWLASAAFDALMRIAANAGVESLLAQLMRAFVFVALLVFVYPFATQAALSRRDPRRVALIASALLGIVYLAAAQLHRRFAIDWLYPHAPGFDPPTSPGMTAVVLAIVALCVLLATYATIALVEVDAEFDAAAKPKD